MKTYHDLVAEAKTRIREVTVDDVMMKQMKPDGTVYVDVREDREWLAGRMPGAVHIGRGVLEPTVHQVLPDPATPIVLICAGGNRSALAADVLQAMGYTNVASMIGGMRAWMQAGGDVVKGEG
jgi:rhodanese-related sulfurtransferase